VQYPKPLAISKENLMSETNYPGIDYGFGKINIDKETGIRFGCIPMSALNEWAWESFVSDYGEPSCPKCRGGASFAGNVDDDGTWEECDGPSEYACADCKAFYTFEECFPEEPHRYTLDDGEYLASIDGDDTFCIIVKSPYYTHAQFAGSCFPGGGYLLKPCPTGPKTYCFGLEWFTDDKPPYPVYEVATGKCVYQPKEDKE
jgi:hypothetical protein